IWGVASVLMAYALGRFGLPEQMPPLVQYGSFLAMFLEMMIAVGIIILLFEASQMQLAAEMHQLVSSDEQLKEMGIRDPLTGLYEDGGAGSPPDEHPGDEQPASDAFRGMGDAPLRRRAADHAFRGGCSHVRDEAGEKARARRTRAGSGASRRSR